MNCFRLATALVITFFLPTSLLCAQEPVSQRTVKTILSVFPNGRGDVWSYDEGTALEGMDGAWYATANGEYFRYIKHCVDRFVGEDGSIRSYKPDEWSLDNVLMGRQLLLLYGVTGQKKYYVAATQIYQQLMQQPRTPEGGFWHKQRYPEQMWLDGLYMAEPFYAEYATEFHHAEDFDDIARQFLLIEQHTRDPKTGLLYHGWDESKKQRWANSSTGDSPSLWSRAMGWYAMGLVDTLAYMPEDHPAHAKLMALLNRFAEAIVKQQDADGVWYQITDKPKVKGNYEESSGSAMFVYALAKGVRKGWLPPSYQVAAQKGYRGILKQFVADDAQGLLTLAGTSDTVGLGGEPTYRDGSYAYYTGTRSVSNDARGLGALLLASNEIEMIPTLQVGAGRTVLLDSWFESETRTDVTGATIPFHYKWNEMDNNGISFLGHAFHEFGAQTHTLYTAPTTEKLAHVDVYIIMDPNFETTPKNPHYNPHPNYMTPEDVKVITDWVKRGGVLLLFANDKFNSEFDHYNMLATQFGITFHQDIRNFVPNDKFEMGALTFDGNQAVFQNGRKIYMKEICTLGVSSPARALLTDKGDTIMAVSHVGKGTVFAVGDPWLYNEYTDGRKLPPEFQNYQAAQDLVRWSLAQTSHARRN